LSSRHGALARGILASGLLKLPYPALKVRYQFVAAVYLADHLAYPGVGVGELALELLLQGLLQTVSTRHRCSPPFIPVCRISAANDKPSCMLIGYAGGGGADQ
jgi:hypothetical protein